MGGNPTEPGVSQTQNQPMIQLETVENHAHAVGQLICWTDVCILIDEGPKAIVVVLLQDSAVVGAARFCLSVKDSVKAIGMYQSGRKIVQLRRLKGVGSLERNLKA